jgi:hypothetical protein
VIPSDASDRRPERSGGLAGEKITGKAISKHLINRSGLYCKILQGGIVRVGDVVRNAPEYANVSTSHTRNHGDLPLPSPAPGYISRMITSVRGY